MGVTVPPETVSPVDAADSELEEREHSLHSSATHQRSGRGAQQQGPGDHRSRVRFSEPWTAHIDDLPLLWRHRAHTSPLVTHAGCRRVV